MSYPMTQQYNLKTYTKSKNTNEKLFRSHINRRDIAFAGLKKEFDKELTIQLCPPMDFYIGCKFKKRIIVAIEDILIKDTETGKSFQSREDVNVTDNVSEIKTSFRYRGWLHDQQPLFVQQVKGKPKLFLLRSGFNRITAAIDLGWKYIIVDIYEDAEEIEDQILFMVS